MDIDFIVLQGVVDGLTKPWGNQIEKAHDLLECKGKDASEQVEMVLQN